MRPKAKGNIAIANAIGYFCSKDYYIFLPVSDDGGPIDLIASPDGVTLQRIQCKYTQLLHPPAKYPDREVYAVDLRQISEHPRNGKKQVSKPKYTLESFDLLFVTTPKGNYLIDWPELCSSLGGPPTTLFFGKKADKYKISTLEAQPFVPEGARLPCPHCSYEAWTEADLESHIQFAHPS